MSLTKKSCEVLDLTNLQDVSTSQTIKENKNEKTTSVVTASSDADQHIQQNDKYKLVTHPFERNENQTVDILSFDIGDINMGCTRLRYHKTQKKVCILHCMLLDLENPYQEVTSNGSIARSVEDVTFPVTPFHLQQPKHESEDLLKKNFTVAQKNSRKRMRVLQEPPYTMDMYFSSLDSTQNLAKRRKVKLDNGEMLKSDAKSWTYKAASLTNALNAHEWLRNDDPTLDFVLLEQQKPTQIPMRIFVGCMITYYECGRALLSHSIDKEDENQNVFAVPIAQRCKKWKEVDSSVCQRLRPIVKVCSSSNKLETENLMCLRTKWTLVQNHLASESKKVERKYLREMVKKQMTGKEREFDTSNYGTRKINSKYEMERIFCAPMLKQPAIQQVNCDNWKDTLDKAVDTVKEISMNPYAAWIVQQKTEKSNVCDAILQAFAWIISLEK